MLRAATDTPPAGNCAARRRTAAVTLAAGARVGVGFGVGVGVELVGVVLVGVVAAAVLNGLVVFAARLVVPRVAMMTTATRAPTMSTAPTTAV
jgi:hypothetical protein